MSPIIELQRRMVEAGRIRAGDKGDKGQPQKLANWRLTSKDRVRLQAASNLWGGEVREWEGHAGEWELYTDTDALPIMLLPGHLPTTWYELWSKGGCQRRCDGVHEVVSDSPCLCGDERECKPYTRLSVLLPDLPGIGSWLLSSTGWNAAAELAGAADLLQRASAQGVLMPARLRLEQRVQVKEGQTRRYAVPVLDVDVAFRELLGQGGSTNPSPLALPQGYTPLTGNGGSGLSLEQGLAQATEQETPRTARSAAPIPEADDLTFDEAPVPVDDEPGAPNQSPVSADTQTQEPQTPYEAYTQLTRLMFNKQGTPEYDEVISRYENGDLEWLLAKIELEQHLAALNALVGQLRDGGHINTRQLWVKVARGRGQKVDDLIAKNCGVGEDGELHWSPLREILMPDEAEALRKALGALWARTQEEANA